MKSALLTLCLAFMTSLLSAQKPGAYKCLDFDGSSDYVVVNDNSSLNPSKSMTVEAWIKADSYGANVWSNSIFCKHGWGRGNVGYVLRCGDGGKLSFNLSDDNQRWQEASSSAVMNTGVWYHVAGTFDGDTIAVYVNGKEVATTLYSGGISTSSGLTARIGDLAYGGGRQFDGMIDEVRVWSSALSEATLRDWMCRKVSSSHPDYSNLEAYWKLDEDSGTTTKDHSSNSNSGTLTNSPTISISGAALGDTSAHTYGGNKVQLNVTNSYSMYAQNISGNPDMVHVYAIQDKTDQGLDSNVTGTVDTTVYFGVYYPYDTSVRYDALLDYTNAKHLSGNAKCGISLFRKSTGYRGKWANTNATYPGGGDSVLSKGEKQSEYVAVFIATDSNKVVTTHTGKNYICGSDSLVLTATGNDSFSYVWYLYGAVISGANKRSLAVDSVGTYRVRVSRASANCQYESTNIVVKQHTPRTVTFSALNDVCQEEDSIQLGGVSPTGGMFAGDGVYGNYFRPIVIGDGSYDITYSVTDTFACTVSKVQTQVVHPTPRLTKSTGVEYCSNQDSIKMDLVSPVGGTYTGNFYFNNYLRLDSAGNKEGFYPYVYSFTSSFGCSNTLTDSVKVKWATPVSIFSKDTACEQDDSISLTGSPSTGTFAGTGVGTNVFYPSQVGKGSYTVYYAFTNALNCTSTASKVITVIPNIQVTWLDTVDLCINADEIALKYGTPSGGYFEGNGTKSPHFFFPSIAGVGQHKLKYVVKDSNGCLSSASLTAVVRDTAQVTYSGPLQHCLQIDPLKLDGALPTGGSYAINGTMVDSLFPSNFGPGQHTLTYNYTGTNGCKSLATYGLNILIPDSISVTADNVHCLEDDAVVVNTYPSNGDLKGKGLIRSIFTPRFAGVGSHDLIYTITDSKSCQVRDTLTMYVYDAPTINLTEIPNICLNADFLDLNALGNSTDSAWFLVNGTVMSEVDPKALGVGQHTVVYKSANVAGCRDSIEKTFEVLPLPPKPTIRLQKNTLVASASRNYQWYNENGMLVDSTNRELNPQANGIYLVKVSSDSGCVVSSDSFSFEYVGLSNILPDYLRVYPNPTNGKVQVTGKHGLKVIVFNSLGQRIEVPFRDGVLDMSQQPNSLYHLVIIDGIKYYVIPLLKN